MYKYIIYLHDNVYKIFWENIAILGQNILDMARKRLKAYVRIYTGWFK